jgi:hypothetical protein
MKRTPIYKLGDLPEDYQKLAKEWSGAYKLIFGKIENGTAILVLQHAGTYKILRLFKFRGHLNISVDVDCGNIQSVIHKLLMAYGE